MTDEFDTERYVVQLDVFEGPLDLLLHLINRNEVSITDIPISLITQQYLETIELGGRITAEHGVGLLRKSFLGLNLDPYQIEILKSLKRAFDPKNILNPGKIFDL